MITISLVRVIATTQEIAKERLKEAVKQAAEEAEKVSQLGLCVFTYASGYSRSDHN